MKIGKNIFVTSSKNKAIYERAIKEGIAISLNQLIETGFPGQKLPRMEILGVCVDNAKDEWIIFGDNLLERPKFSIDAITEAIKALRNEMEPFLIKSFNKSATRNFIRTTVRTSENVNIKWLASLTSEHPLLPANKNPQNLANNFPQFWGYISGIFCVEGSATTI